MKRLSRSKRDRELEILAAAEELFLERGYALTSTVQIAERVGCNQALVHYYFRSKENLFRIIYSKKVESLIQGVISLDDEHLPFEQTIAHIIETHMKVWASDPRLPWLFFNEMNQNPAMLDLMRQLVIAKIPRKSINRLEKRLKKEIAAGRVRKMTLVDLLMTIGSLNGMLLIARPIFLRLLDLAEEKYAALVRHRCQENIAIVLRSLRP